METRSALSARDEASWEASEWAARQEIPLPEELPLD
jgi:hypothetical protein